MDHKPHEHSIPSPSFWRPILTAQMILAVCMAMILGGAAYLGNKNSGPAGIIAAMVAFLVCWIPNAASLLIMSFTRDPQLSVSTKLLAMLLRMAVPIVFIIVLTESKHWLATAGTLGMIMVFYLVALVVETPLSLWVIRMSRDRVSPDPQVKVS